MLRALFSLEKMSYEPVSGTVIYRSRMHKTLKRNFQIMSVADWLAQLCRHIPDRFEILSHLGLRAPQQARGRQPGQPAMRVRLAEPVYCPSGAKPIDCHVVFPQ
jgi:hypothetical protein